MSTLTKKERDGLDDVFMSIHSNSDKYRKLKGISSLITAKDYKFSMHTLLEQAKQGLKETNFSHFLAYIAKKKKFLSK